MKVLKTEKEPQLFTLTCFFLGTIRDHIPVLLPFIAFIAPTGSFCSFWEKVNLCCLGKRNLVIDHFLLVTKVHLFLSFRDL